MNYPHPIMGSNYFLVRHSGGLEILSRVGYLELVHSGCDFQFIRMGYETDLVSEKFLLETSYFNDKKVLEILTQLAA